MKVTHAFPPNVIAAGNADNPVIVERPMVAATAYHPAGSNPLGCWKTSGSAPEPAALRARRAWTDRGRLPEIDVRISRRISRSGDSDPWMTPGDSNACSSSASARRSTRVKSRPLRAFWSAVNPLGHALAMAGGMVPFGCVIWVTARTRACPARS
jgi:hypothetical protein